MKLRNPCFDYLRITMEINNRFGMELDKGVIRRILSKHYKPTHSGGNLSWLTCIGHSIDSLWSIDLFSCESLSLRSQWVMVIMDQFTRRIIGLAATRGHSMVLLSACYLIILFQDNHCPNI